MNGRASVPLHAVAIFFGVGWWTGCGAAPEPPREALADLTVLPVDRSLPPPGEREPHIADALAELALAERALEVSLAPAAPSAAPLTPPPTPSAARPPDGQQTPARTPGEELARSEPSIGCEVACRALASMRRSARYVCELAGAEDLRCTDATARVGGASERVMGAKCACGVAP